MVSDRRKRVLCWHYPFLASELPTREQPREEHTLNLDRFLWGRSVVERGAVLVTHDDASIRHARLVRR